MMNSTMPCKVGCLCTFNMRYWDTQINAFRIKARPALVIGDMRNNDYTVLPFSRITKCQYFDPEYDVKVDPQMYPKLGLTAVSYVRAHKQCTQNAADLGKVIADLKTEYPDLFLSVMALHEQWNNLIKENCF